MLLLSLFLSQTNKKREKCHVAFITWHYFIVCRYRIPSRPKNKQQTNKQTKKKHKPKNYIQHTKIFHASIRILAYSVGEN